jgi:hypothetical protein
MDHPFEVGGHQLYASVSIGISCFPADGTECETLFKNADTAMYRAKAEGRNKYRFFSAEMNACALENLLMSNSLRTALENDELLLHYQPQYDLRSGRISGIMFRANRSRHFRASLPLYDFAFTTKPWELTAYQRAGARCVRSIPEAVDESRFRPRTTTPEQRAAFGTAVSFIGRYEPHYARTLRAVAESGHDLGVWGPRWPRYARRHGWARPFVRAGGVWFDDYPVALSCTGIALGLLSKRFPETTTTRSFEIPACGTFLLAERTEDHLALYAEGREAEFFADRDELIDKLRFYAVNRDAREQIARAGRERYLRSGYTRRARFREMLDVVTRA